MTSSLLGVLPSYARQRSIDLPAEIFDEAVAQELPGGEDALDDLASRLGWPVPIRLEAKPGAEDFPLLHHHPDHGWVIVEQWINAGDLRIRTIEGPAILGYRSGLALLRPAIPDCRPKGQGGSALAIFWQVLMRRRSMLWTAVLATIIVNFVTLATSLYSMQVYDRVIPRGSFSTLWVLTVGVIIALLIDFALRTTRALMMERESAAIDAEVSDYFFARAQAVRLDARPPGVGTMAAQLRGLEQVRSILSAGSIFLVADLPFALFFILVIAALGGVIALVPLISFPIALLLGFLFARLIRNDTDKAQVSGTRKNGLLVEAFDAAETIKANRGHWHMLGRWNRLVADVHQHEDPVKRWSSVTGSIFSTLQQISYVALVAVGAVEVAAGHMTTGSLIAAAIIAGRVNGPLVAQLPSMLVQWSYARSSLRMLDGIMALPVDEPEGMVALRPERLRGALRVKEVIFAYPGSRETVNLPHLAIAEGERVAIIGGIGSGKSTLLKLMAGLYAPASGQLTIGGLDVQHVASDVLRRHVGYLPQDVRLINGSLRDNILLGLPNPGDDKILAAAAQTGLAGLISGNPLGLDLPIAEGGRGLSGGQRAIAGLTRLMLAEPRLFLLDEPTANLDPATEEQVLRLIDGRLKATGGTLVMVTHRLQLLGIVSRLIVMQNGRVALDGPTKEVLARLRSSSSQTPTAAHGAA
ncbi:ATP-binding cassette domain-containing protein [Sphingobium sp. CFD-2]|uniref:ATP-binding cassette domain-containing protein n=1 Tax=Sphingobium sp. CFD-2 TaxID=2878542 RepID=UPI00214CB9F2|nr:ATP-binding cassette domain-containing protein [Sphingobium sp. CFD-2]